MSTFGSANNTETHLLVPWEKIKLGANDWKESHSFTHLYRPRAFMTNVELEMRLYSQLAYNQQRFVFVFCRDEEYTVVQFEQEFVFEVKKKRKKNIHKMKQKHEYGDWIK